MTFGAYLGLLGAWVTAIATPGPDTVQLLRLGARSRRNAMAAALGMCVGNAIWPIVTMAGLAALIKAFPWVLTVMYCAGGLFLLIMGVSALRGGIVDLRTRALMPIPGRTERNVGAHSEASNQEEAMNAANQPARKTLVKQLSDFQAWRLGLASNLSNPKALLFFAAVFAQFLPTGLAWSERLLVLVMMTSVCAAWFFTLAWAVSQPGWAEKLRVANPWIEVVAGTLFCLLGGFLLYQAAIDIF